MVPAEYFYSLVYENYAKHPCCFYCPSSDPTKLKNLLDFEDRAKNVIRASMPTYVMYDQEPLDIHAFDTYKDRMLHMVNPDQHHTLEQLELGELLAWRLSVADFPIWCHSEKHSDEIENLRKHQAIPCYYWYHAIIARDWFRYWQRYRNLLPTDKSRAPYRFLLYARDHTGSRAYRKDLVKGLESIKQTVLYNWQAAGSVDAGYSAKIEPSDAMQSGIHLVAETLFATNKIHLTEKIFKPMVMSQPFIVWGPPGTLAYLRDYGFQTFSHVWSESYDLESDHSRRMDMLLDLVKKIARMPQERYSQLYKQCLPQIQHNRERFYSQSFMDDCWSELETNWERAETERQALLDEFPGGQWINLLAKNHAMASQKINRAVVGILIAKLEDHRRDRVLAMHPQFTELVWDSSRRPVPRS